MVLCWPYRPEQSTRQVQHLILNLGCWPQHTGMEGCMCCLQAAVANSDMGFFGALPVSMEQGSNKRKSMERGLRPARAEPQHVGFMHSCSAAGMQCSGTLLHEQTQP